MHSGFKTHLPYPIPFIFFFFFFILGGLGEKVPLSWSALAIYVMHCNLLYSLIKS